MKLQGWTARRRWISLTAIAGTPAWGPRLAAGAFFWSLAVPFLYEGYAIIFRGDPTISRMMSYQLTAHGWYVGIPLAFLLGAVCLLLIAHFAGLIAIWRP